MRHSFGGALFDFSKQWVTPHVHEQLIDLAHASGIPDRRSAMFSGEKINISEGRAVLHSALRGGAQADAGIAEDVAAVLAQMATFTSDIESGRWRGCTEKPITDVVHIGIGGSHLGPELVVGALSDYKRSRLRIHFIANIDANDFHRACKDLNPEQTLFIIASKSFGTLETKINALTARSWFLERTNAVEDIHKHFVGVTTNIADAVEFGLDADNLFPLWDWVGGRYSLWSAVGLPIMLSLGVEGFHQFLGGAREADTHFADAELAHNIPALSALYATWNYNFLGANSLAVLSYDERLRLLPEYLQQLEMESNGKSVSRDGHPIQHATMPILWGGTGTRGQHAYHQLLHQGNQAYAADFIVVAKDDRNLREHHEWLLANAFAQSQAMAVGFTADANEPHRAVAGNHSTTTIVLDELGPRQLGALLATYEHKVFCQGVIWDINSFDQWGVELGKNLSLPIREQLAHGTDTADQDEATAALIAHLRSQ